MTNTGLRGLNQSIHESVPFLLAGIVSIVSIHGIAPPVRAQVIPDRTVSTRVRSANDQNFVIDQGHRVGQTLFHSFEEFSVPTNGSAHFDQAVDVAQVIGRVTGSHHSTIDGRLQSNGRADVFLINPNGFLFGPNATLDIGGSFLATSADRLLFDDGQFFSASRPQLIPLLTVSAPVGLQMSQESRGITLRGNGHQLSHFLDFAKVQNLVTQSDTQLDGLHVRTGQTLAFIGAGIVLDGGILTAPAGQVELGSVTQGRVKWTPQWRFDYEEATAFGAIQLTQRALVNVSSLRSGTVNLYGENLFLTSGATILAQQKGTRPGRPIRLTGTESIRLQGTAPGGTPRTQIRTETFGENTNGVGSDIYLSTPRLQLDGGSAVASATFGASASGAIQINSTGTVKIQGFSPDAPDATSSSSTIASLTMGAGDAGPIGLSTPRLAIRDGGNLVSLSLIKNGNGGNIAINSPAIRLEGFNPRLSIGGISVGTLGLGNAGNLAITTERLAVNAGAFIDSSTLADGDAGNIVIRAAEYISLDGVVPTMLQDDGDIRSSINSVTNEIQNRMVTIPGLPEIPSGNAGRIELHTPSLRIANGAQVNISARGPGNSRALLIDAQQIDVLNGSQISATTTTGNGGNMRIQTDRLRLDNGLINASVLDTGTGGNIQINAAETIEIIGTGSQSLQETVIIPSFAREFRPTSVDQGIWAIATQNGTPGKINLNTRELVLTNGAIVQTVTFGNQAGGNITVRDASLVHVEESILNSSSYRDGNAGNITIETERLLAQSGGEILAITFGSGNAGRLRINANESIVLEGRSRSDHRFPSGLLASTQNDAPGEGGNVDIQTPRLVLRDGAKLSVSAETNILQLSEDNTSTRRRDLREQRRNNLPALNPLGEAITEDGAIAGTIDARVGWLILEQGEIQATSARGEGGNINLAIANGLVMSAQSGISTEAGTDNLSGGNGGNITITSPFLVGLEDSDIVANAFRGNGGNIDITTEALLGFAPQNGVTAGSDITASSELGVSGTVDITTPDVNPETATAILSSAVLDEDQSIATTCDAMGESQFVMTGQGGLPSDPGSGSDRPWVSLLQDFGDLGTLPGNETSEPLQAALTFGSALSTPSTVGASSIPHAEDAASALMETRVPKMFLKEATMMAIADDGTIQLMADIGVLALASHPRTCT